MLLGGVHETKDSLSPKTAASPRDRLIAGWRVGASASLTEAARRVVALVEKIQPAAVGGGGDPAWILALTPAQIKEQFAALEARVGREGAEKFSLLGVPFAIKDNIDFAGLPTTAACPAFAYTPKETAPAVQRLLDAGAILVGKTNLDQFATGLVGTRSPYGVVPNVFNPDYVSGGSSSGSASVVARGIVPFALGTDTAGSGRVPAGFNNLVGLKPTRGWLSTRGVLPACRSLDCVSVFAAGVEDAALVASIAGAPDADGYSRAVPAGAFEKRLPAKPRFGVPAAPEWFGDAQAEAAFARALDRARATGAEIVPMDFSPFFEVAALLYQGPWVAERYTVAGELLETNPGAVHPVVRGIIARGTEFDAASVFRAHYKLADLKRGCDGLLATVDALLVPTAPRHPSIADVLASPVEINSQLGTYTNFVNLLDWSALALPAGFRDDGLPAGITLIGPAWADAALAEFGARWERREAAATGRGAALPFPERKTVRLAVVGAHLSGLPLNHQLTERGAVLVEKTKTSADYRFYALPGTTPPKPGLVRIGKKDTSPDAGIEVELWDVPEEKFGSFVAAIPPPLGIGTLTLADGREVKGFICEAWAAEGAEDITHFGGWRAYLARGKKGAAG
ncbi:allophanate hydrolase [Termitidicoccus mucosus]|uniref:Allophanate hydrolase n=1 Tax=Termitidicoccus mucosus TaxID=1184151 RepID=A0A178II27_9BACT|nr:allophanate hydrolase [Opitutaceae bacterium TSB47]